MHYDKRNANLVTRAVFWSGDSISSVSQPDRGRAEKQRKTTRVSNKVIHELRIKLSSSQDRFLCFFTHHNYIIMYTAFYKTTDRVPNKFIPAPSPTAINFISISRKIIWRILSMRTIEITGNSLALRKGITTPAASARNPRT